MRPVGVLLIKLAQPAPVGIGPVVEIVECGFRISAGAVALAQAEQCIVKGFGQVGSGDHAQVRRDENVLQEAGYQ
jgi:hypothetical protein